MAFEWFKNFWETHGGIGYVHQANLERRQARRLKAVITRLVQHAAKIKTAVGTGEKKEIQKEFDTYSKNMKIEVVTLQKIIVEEKRLLKHNLDYIHELSVMIGRDKGLTESQQGELQGKVINLWSNLQAEAKKMIQDLGSFSNTAYTFSKALDEPSQIAELYFKAIEDRTDTKRLKSAFADELKKLNNTKVQFEEHRAAMTKVEKYFSDLVAKQLEIFEKILLIFQYIQKDISAQRTYLGELRTKEAYPEFWMKSNMLSLDGIDVGIPKFIESELSQERILLSTVEHQEPAKPKAA